MQTKNRQTVGYHVLNANKTKTKQKTAKQTENQRKKNGNKKP